MAESKFKPGSKPQTLNTRSKCHNFSHRNIIFGKWVQYDKRKWKKNIICENIFFGEFGGPFKMGV